MSPTHATKRGTRYRYYVSRPLMKGTAKTPIGGQRIPAAPLEILVTRRIHNWLAEPVAVLNAIKIGTSDAVQQGKFIESVRHHTAKWQELPADEIRSFMRSIVRRIQVHRIDISLDQDRLAKWVDRVRCEIQLNASSQSDTGSHLDTQTKIGRSPDRC